jgi:YD repeat-containing protein
MCWEATMAHQLKMATVQQILSLHADAGCAGRLVEKIDRMGRRTRYQYNVLDQVLAEKWYASGWVAGAKASSPRPSRVAQVAMANRMAPVRSSPSSLSSYWRSSARGRPPLGSVDAWASRRALRRPCASVHTRLVFPEVFLDMTGSFRRLSKQDSRFQARPVVK